MKKKWHRKGNHSSSVSGLNRLMRLQTWKKVMGWCTARWKCCCFVWNHGEKVTQICLKKSTYSMTTDSMICVC